MADNKLEMAEYNNFSVSDSQKKLAKKAKQNSGYSKINTDDKQDDFDYMKIEKERVITDRYGYDDFAYALPIRIEKSKSFFFKRIGNTFSFFGDRDGNPLFMIGPHWPMYVCFSSIMTLATFLFLFTFWEYLHLIFKIFGVVNYTIFILSYTYTALINPGFPKNDLDSRTGEPRNKFRFCDKCKMWVNVEKKTNHCFECNICVEGYDHHCPWTSKCIGRRNTRTFYVFIVSLLFLFAYMVCALTNAQSNRGRKK